MANQLPSEERIVYFLGAGFSAPLGLPVMADFLLRSKDLYFSAPQRHAHFAPVLETIEKMAKAKNYYNVDLFNIEEILSLLEMEDYVGSSAHKEAYLVYLRDVVQAFTPEFTVRSERDAWTDFRPSHVNLASEYAAFVASLFGLQWERVDGGKFFSTECATTVPRYSIITLNYDLVLENALHLLREVVRPRIPLVFSTSLEQSLEPGQVRLAKLHGSVKPLTIVPPTWNKVANEDVIASWRLAYRLLAEATQIRFIGYSLPPSDTYVRYLLASAVLESKHLKYIDTLCLDAAGSVRSRYELLINYFKFRFRHLDATRYLTECHRSAAQAIEYVGNRNIVKFDKLEYVHSELLRQP